MDRFDLKGKVAVVTGGNGGIGFGMARGLARAGANIAVVGRNAGKSARAVSELESIGARGGRDRGGCHRIRHASTHGRDRGRNGSAGSTSSSTTPASTFENAPRIMSEDEWRTVMDTNITSAFLASKACYPFMKRAGRGKILNNGSMLSIFGAPWAPAYAASKGGMVQLTKSLATAWADDGIQVNCFLPGWIRYPAHGPGPEGHRGAA